MKIRRSVIALLTLIMVGGCSIRLGGPGPVGYRTLAFSMGPGASPGEAAEYIRQAGADLVLIAAQADSAWFAELARESKLTLSGPGPAGDVSLAFLGAAPLGDTTLALPLKRGGEVVIHDALYRVDKTRYLDLLAVRVESSSLVRESMQALLQYIATDVMSHAAVVLAVDVPDTLTGDAVAALLSPAFIDARSCLGTRGEASGGGSGAGMRLFYGPEARLRCQSARRIGEGAEVPLVAQLVIGR